MGSQWTDICTYITGVVRYKDLAYLSLIGNEESEKRLSQSIIVSWDAGSWGSEDELNKKWDTVGATISKFPLEQAIFLGENGQICCVGSGDIHDEQISTTTSSPEKRGAMRGIKRIGECVYAVGMNRQVYLRDKLGSWKDIGNETRPLSTHNGVVGFESIDGFNENEIYAVGWEGEIWEFKNKHWFQKDSPTNFVLVGVCCAGDGNVYVCGRLGLLIRGRGDVWEIIKHETITDDIWGMAWFNDELYLSTMDSVYVLENDDSLSIVEMGEDRAETCFHLSTADGVLWSIGAKDIMAFDGKTWSRID